MRRASVLIAVVAIAHGCAAQPLTPRQPPASNGFAIDPTRPYLEIVFERVGLRVPVMPGESSQGIWLRFRNNCPYLVELPAISAEHQNDGTLLQFDVIDVTPRDRPVIGAPVAFEVPTGYSEFSHTPRVVQVPPGGDVVFSLPLESVTFRTVIRVQPLIRLPVFAGKESPLTLVEFSWAGLPAEVQRSLKR